ncbi:hypothetical protein PC121_g5193 [Phytophthora cactorum]|nr:hypothetical protein PC120_g10085 [Phytophthora cactorum]KAG3085316.1 hypothetical protein PC121_g5193 [Phytophthora cactorum]KAG4060592.1 hypothetical protein PC123_g4491 [Phytophthora cactorum]
MRIGATCPSAGSTPFWAITTEKTTKDSNTSISLDVVIRIPKQFRVQTKRIAGGPYPIQAVHDNGTVTLDKGATQQQISIHRVFPC